MRTCEQRGLANGKRRFVAKEGGGLPGEGSYGQRSATCAASPRASPQLPQTRRGDRGAAIERPARCGNAIGGLTSRAIERATTKFAAAPRSIPADLMRSFALAKFAAIILASLRRYRPWSRRARPWALGGRPSYRERSDARFPR